jgi:hypothetical protein
MHPMLIMAVADEVDRERRSERKGDRARSVSVADGAAAAVRVRGLAAVQELGRRFRVASSARARLS